MTETNRRDFLAASAVSAAAVLAPAGVFAAADDTVKVGVIGTGGRGTGAAENCLNADKGVKIVALGDAFEWRVNGCAANLRKKFKDRADVPADHCFTGLDAYQKVIDSGVDLVILATPPGFRPIHLEAAVKAGKHIFTEKPVAVDAAGIRRVLALVEESKKKNIAIVAGTQRRHQKGYIDTIAKLHNDKAKSATSPPPPPTGTTTASGSATARNWENSRRNRPTSLTRSTTGTTSCGCAATTLSNSTYTISTWPTGFSASTRSAVSAWAAG